MKNQLQSTMLDFHLPPVSKHVYDYFSDMANPFTFELPMSSLVIKYSLFAWNFLLFILGIVLIAAGFSVATEYATSGDGLSELINNKYISLPIFIGVIGIMISLITFFGCYGSIKVIFRICKLN